VLSIADHIQRHAMANELHARPFPVVAAPIQAAYLAMKPAVNVSGRDRDADWAHLLALLNYYDAQHPLPGATYYFGQIGKHTLKWERHTEFVTYTIFVEDEPAQAFDPKAFAAFSHDWLTVSPGTRFTSALI
jgi:uncharacterized membrane-anchored protein